MSDRLVISLFLLAISAILTITCSWAVFRPNANGGQIDINIPLVGSIKTNYLAMGMAFLAIVLGYFVYTMWRDQPDNIDLVGTVTIDQASLPDIDAVLIGVTSNPWSQTVLPEGKLNLKIPVPKSWNSYTAYAFVYGRSNLRPDIVGVRLEDPKFALELKP